MLWESLDKQQAVTMLALGISMVLAYHLFHTHWQLQNIPGPLFAKFTNLHRFVLVRCGFIHLYQAKAHQRHGPIVRFGPNMVSICDPEAIHTIFHMRSGFVKACNSRLRQALSLFLSAFWNEDYLTETESNVPRLQTMDD
jgi:hypothetical protein